MENGLNKHGGTMCSSMQKGVGMMVADVEQTVKIGNQENNAGMTAGIYKHASVWCV